MKYNIKKHFKAQQNLIMTYMYHEDVHLHRECTNAFTYDNNNQTTCKQQKKLENLYFFYIYIIYM